MTHELVHPNWHVILIHYPLALLTLGLGIEVFSLLGGRRAARGAGRWMVLLGALSCVPAATTGAYAFYDVVRHAGQGEAASEPGGEPWYRLAREARLSGEQFDDLKHHVWHMAGGTVIVLAAVITFLGASDGRRRRAYWPCLILALFAVGVMIKGAWHAGESVYTRGTAVEYDATGPEVNWKRPARTLEQFVPPLQLHVLLAGLAFAAALAALGTSARAMGADRAAREVADADETGSARPASDEPTSLQTEMIVVAPRHRVARFWVAAGMLALATAAGGAWVAGLFGVWERLMPLLAQPRDLAHSILGGAIVVLTLLLAGLTRWARGRRATIGLAAAVLLVAMALQVWVGILLMYDGSDRASSLYRFTRPTVQDPHSPSGRG